MWPRLSIFGNIKKKVQSESKYYTSQKKYSKYFSNVLTFQRSFYFSVGSPPQNFEAVFPTFCAESVRGIPWKFVNLRWAVVKISRIYSPKNVLGITNKIKSWKNNRMAYVTYRCVGLKRRLACPNSYLRRIWKKCEPKNHRLLFPTNKEKKKKTRNITIPRGIVWRTGVPPPTGLSCLPFSSHSLPPRITTPRWYRPTL